MSIEDNNQFAIAENTESFHPSNEFSIGVWYKYTENYSGDAHITEMEFNIR